MRNLTEFFSLFAILLKESGLLQPEQVEQMDQLDQEGRVDPASFFIQIYLPEIRYEVGHLGFESVSGVEETDSEGNLIQILQIQPTVSLWRHFYDPERFGIFTECVLKIQKLFQKLSGLTQEPVRIVVKTSEQIQLEEAKNELISNLKRMRIAPESTVFMKDPDRFGFPAGDRDFWIQLSPRKKSIRVFLEGGRIRVQT